MAFGKSPGRRGAATPRAGLAASLVLHAVAVAAILSHPPTRAAIATAMPITVSLITPSPAVEPKAPPLPLDDAISYASSPSMFDMSPLPRLRAALFANS